MLQGETVMESQVAEFPVDKERTADGRQTMNERLCPSFATPRKPEIAVRILTE